MEALAAVCSEPLWHHLRFWDQELPLLHLEPKTEQKLERGRRKLQCKKKERQRNETCLSKVLIEEEPHEAGSSPAPLHEGSKEAALQILSPRQRYEKGFSLPASAQRLLRTQLLLARR